MLNKIEDLTAYIKEVEHAKFFVDQSQQSLISIDLTEKESALLLLKNNVENLERVYGKASMGDCKRQFKYVKEALNGEDALRDLDDVNWDVGDLNIKVQMELTSSLKTLKNNLEKEIELQEHIKSSKEGKDVLFKSSAFDLGPIEGFFEETEEIVEMQESNFNAFEALTKSQLDKVAEMLGSKDNNLQVLGLLDISRDEAFDLLLRYEGIIGYSDKIKDMYERCFGKK